MNHEIANSLKEAITVYLGPHLSQFHWHKIYIADDELELLIKEKEDSISQAVIIRLTVAEDFKEIHISNIFMPMSMRRQGIGKGLIAKIYEAAKPFGFSLFLVQMTESFYNRMVKRDAVVIQEGDCVQITDQTNLAANG